jgi:hypothetical protein
MFTAGEQLPVSVAFILAERNLRNCISVQFLISQYEGGRVCQLCRDIRNIEPLQSPFLLSAVHSYISQCLRTGSLFYRYSVYAKPLPYEMYQILALKVFKMCVCVCVCVCVHVQPNPYFPMHLCHLGVLHLLFCGRYSRGLELVDLLEPEWRTICTALTWCAQGLLMDKKV